MRIAIVMNGSVMATDAETLRRLACDMKSAVDLHNKAGRPNSGDLA